MNDHKHDFVYCETRGRYECAICDATLNVRLISYFDVMRERNALEKALNEIEYEAVHSKTHHDAESGVTDWRSTPHAYDALNLIVEQLEKTVKLRPNRQVLYFDYADAVIEPRKVTGMSEQERKGEGYVEELDAMVQACTGCGCLVADTTQCERCYNEPERAVIECGDAKIKRLLDRIGEQIEQGGYWNAIHATHELLGVLILKFNDALKGRP